MPSRRRPARTCPALAARLTLRARLTLIHAGLFFLAGAVLLATTYALFNRQLSQRGQLLVTKGDPAVDGAAPATQTFGFTDDGKLLAGQAAERWMRDQQAVLHDAATTSLLGQGAVALLLVGATAAAVAWLVTRRVLAPLQRVTDAARAISAAPAAERLPREPVPVRARHDEVTDLAAAFNTMLERLDRSFDGQRRFVANASHELRTPLTLSRSLVELAVHRHPASTELARLGEQLAHINARHEQLLTGLLVLANAENQLATRDPVDLADVVAQVVAQTAHEAADTGITLNHQVAPARTLGDALLLERLVHNLVENGIRHNIGTGGRVHVTTRTDDDTTVIEVCNTGPDIPPDQTAALFEPFHRLPASHPPTSRGNGLGLSIVRAIAHAHGGTATTHPNRDGGLTVTITLPTLPPGTPLP